MTSPLRSQSSHLTAGICVLVALLYTAGVWIAKSSKEKRETEEALKIAEMRREQAARAVAIKAADEAKAEQQD